jgi:hypothetical protein
LPCRFVRCENQGIILTRSVRSWRDVVVFGINDNNSLCPQGYSQEGACLDINLSLFCANSTAPFVVPSA